MNIFDSINIDNFEVVSNVHSLYQLTLSSIFTDSKITNNKTIVVPNQRGFMGDLLNDNLNISIGSKVWCLQNSRNIKQTQISYESYIKSSINWLKNENYIKDYLINSIINDNIIIVTIQYVLFNNEKVTYTIQFNI